MRDFFLGSASTAWVAGGMLPSAGHDSAETASKPVPAVISYRSLLRPSSPRQTFVG